jgi:integrase
MKGTMKERTPGTWQLRVYTGTDPRTGNPRQSTKTFKGGKRAAESALASFVTEVEQGRTPLSSSTTVAELLDKYIEYQTPMLQPTTIRGYGVKARKIKPVLGSLKVSKLTAQELDRAYRGWLAEGLEPATVRHFHTLLSAALNQAVRWGVVPFAVTDRATPPPARNKGVPEIAPETVQALIRAAEHSRAPLLPATIALAAITGCRRGELAGLRWSDLNTTAGTIKVQRAIKLGLDGKLVVGPTKSHADRTISLDPLTISVLSRRLVEANKTAEDAGVQLDPDGYIISYDPTGAEPMNPDSISQAYGRVAARAGIKVRFHDLRHFAATQLIGAGIDVRTVAERLGHADPSITLRVYASAIEAKDREAAAVLGRLVVGEPSAVAADVEEVLELPAGDPAAA